MEKLKYRFIGWMVCLFLGVTVASAQPNFDTTCPLSFFTNVASRLVAEELKLDLTQIPIYPTNRYTPALQRLLQVTANIYDATTTNFYPTVFRPVFSTDATGTQLFISGYQQVISVSGSTDSQLALPLDAAVCVSGGQPFTNRALNVFGVPWILGAKQGLPNFNRLAMVNAVQVTRKLQVMRSSTNSAIAQYQTNQMYVMSITNNVSLSFWNSYNTDYVPHSGLVQVYAFDILDMQLTNPVMAYPASGNPARNVFTFSFATNLWPGALWTANGHIPPNGVASATSFIATNWSYAFMTNSIYRFGMASFVDVSGGYEVAIPSLPPLPTFGLMTTNRLQAYILDGTNIIDYVQLSGPTSSRNLNQELADPDYPDSTGAHYQWSTNLLFAGAPSYGILDQLIVSQTPSLAPVGNAWVRSPDMPATIPTTLQSEALYFLGFFQPAFFYGNAIYTNTSLTTQAPYTPVRTIYEYTELQANDPLVHYLASDLNYIDPTMMGRRYSDDPTSQPIPVASKYSVIQGNRYQPWGLVRQMPRLVAVDTNASNLAFKDPLIWTPDYWNFPTGQVWNLSWLGQVHRGTPWQTFYLKAPDLLREIRYNSNVSYYIGTNTWVAWTGDTNLPDATVMAPVADWRLAGLLGALLNTNDLATQFSVNNPDPAAWASCLDGLVAMTNTATVPYPGANLGFASMVLSSNAPVVSLIASAIQAYKALMPGLVYTNIGDLLAVPALSSQSPFLNQSSLRYITNGITDAAYEALPSQLLPLLRADSIGAMAAAADQWQLQFSGYDGHTYVIQASPDLIQWRNISTNQPSAGQFYFNVQRTASQSQEYYRSVLQP